ncbi:PqiC family protein [Pacificoceanicola onchidii]|uniref:PqiC family protein n=1 Tax=Pacificoceanicola onchidii TaxID=2562685 RepID=UPI0010A3C4C9|nr:PqiC family protein [Pacificoceanicola onchidii]
MMTRLSLLSLTLFLSACGGVDLRFDTPPTAVGGGSALPEERVSVRYARIEVATVTLPTYAQDEEIVLRDDSGAIAPSGGLWADEPGRAVTLQLARDLDAITGRLVAPEPWPFRDLPDVKVDVRIEDFFATSGGTFRLSGQMFVAPEDYGTDRARRFEIEVPVTGEMTPGAIAAARARAVSDLAAFVARKGLR